MKIPKAGEDKISFTWVRKVCNVEIEIVTLGQCVVDRTSSRGYI